MVNLGFCLFISDPELNDKKMWGVEEIRDVYEF